MSHHRWDDRDPRDWRVFFAHLVEQLEAGVDRFTARLRAATQPDALGGLRAEFDLAVRRLEAVVSDDVDVDGLSARILELSRGYPLTPVEVAHRIYDQVIRDPLPTSATLERVVDELDERSR